MSGEPVNTYISSLGNSGPEWLIAGALVLLFGYAVIKIIPTFQESKERRDEAYTKKIDAEIELEKARELRKAEESKARERRDIERSESEGKWIQLGESMVQASEAMTMTMKGLEAAINESKIGSRKMQDKLDVVYAKIVGGYDKEKGE